MPKAKKEAVKETVEAVKKTAPKSKPAKAAKTEFTNPRQGDVIVCGQRVASGKTVGYDLTKFDDKQKREFQNALRGGLLVEA